MDYEIMMNNNLKIGMEAPDFDAVSTMGDISLSNYLGCTHRCKIAWV